MRKHPFSLAFGAAAFFLASAAHAVAPTGRSTAQLELRDGTEGTISPLFDAQPRSQRGAAGLRGLRADLGAKTKGIWRSATGVPSHLWGFAIPAPRDADGARKLASATLERHLAVLAPGAAMSDFTFVADLPDQATGVRKLVFQQTWRGLPVVGAFLSASFKNDHLFGIGSRALPHVDAVMPDALVSTDAARAAATAWIASESESATPGEVDGPFVLPFDDHGALTYRVVLRARVEAERPVGSYQVYVDASTGEPIARHQLLQFETARLELQAWQRSPSFGERLGYAADRVSVELGATQATGECSPEGDFSFEGEAASGTATLQGSHVAVTNDAGEDATFSFEAGAGDTVVWAENADEERDAQVVAYVHGGLIKAYAHTFAPDLDFLDEPVKVTVNVDDVCNAYSDGTRIHFYTAGSGCENTARIADVVYHEYGHSIHCHTYAAVGIGSNCIPDGALSEGIADYTAATFTGDHGMGRGFFYDASPLRDIDPEQDRVWPTDLVGEAHYDGEIIGGTLWDLRKALVEDLGEEEGVATANRLYHGALKHAYDIPSMYPEMLLVDDDDGDVSNGTPHQCAINAAFAHHGLRPVETTTEIPAIAPPTQAGAEVAVGLGALSDECGDSLESAYLTWADASDPTQTGTIAMTVRDDGLVHATIPTKRAGAVIRFSVDVQTPNADLHFPQNDADPTYQLYVGEVTPIFCADFETDPFAAGWTHELISGVDELGADDWMWGPPGGDGLNGDPMVAFGGNNVVGQDLSPEGETNWDGHYKPERHTALVSPVIAAGGFQEVRLQYRRWLNVEDGHFDDATILANGQLAWQNFDSDLGDQGSHIHHQDREWRFQDVDLTPYLAQDGSVQLRFEMQSDQGLELGGWTMDDVCVVGVKSASCPAGQACGPTPSGSSSASSGAGGLISQSDDGATDDAADDGCDCEVRGSSRSGSAGAVVGLAAIALMVARRRRRG